MKRTTLEWVRKAEGDWEIALKAYRARKKPVYDAACYHRAINALKNTSKADWLKPELPLRRPMSC